MTQSSRPTLISQNIKWTILAIVSFSLAISLTLLLLSLHREQTRQQLEFSEDIIWSMTQVEREGRVFLDAIYRYRESPLPAIHSEALVCFDIFWSRVYSLDQGDIGAFFFSLEGAEENLKSFKAMLRHLDPLVAAIDNQPEEKTKIIITEILEALPAMHALANKGSTANLKQLEKKRERFKDLYIKAILLLAGSVLAGAILIFQILRQQKSLDILSKKLEQRMEIQSADLRTSKQNLKLLSQAVEQSPASVIICSQQGNIEYVNAQFEKISGYRADEVIGRNPNILKSGKTPAETYANMWELLKEGQEWRGEICNKGKNGNLYWEQVSISPIYDEDTGITRFLAVQENITQRKHYEEQLLHKANYDNLTQLPNRVLALDRLEHAIRQAKRRREMAGLMFLDLDNFKQVNDTLGHEGGDLLLQKAAQRLASCLRECDTPARFGGDEFIAILSDLKSKNDARQILDRVIEAFSKPFNLLGTSTYATTSIGISFSPDDGDNPALLLKNADSAMYIAKAEGKSGYRIFGEDATQETMMRQRIETHLPQALSNHELELVFQPVINGENKIVAAEALLRWNNETLGQVIPENFLPVAEETGAIVNIGEWVVSTACLEALRWQKAAGYAIDLNINISGYQLHHPGFLHIIEHELLQSGLQRENLVLEIKESSLSTDSRTIAVLEKLTSLGLRLALDDFGSGSTTVSLLQKLSIDSVKINREYIAGNNQRTRDNKLSSAIINLGRCFSTSLVAKGIENELELAFAKMSGCTLFQGYHIGKPLPPELFIKTLQTYSEQ
jgi:diguanylate cyclase (GGDEF)-like protein/PAS domain S-box-containing protein